MRLQGKALRLSKPRLGPQSDISGLLGAKKNVWKNVDVFVGRFFFGEAVFWSYRMLVFFLQNVSTLKPESQVVCLNWKKYREDLDMVKAPLVFPCDLESSKLIRNSSLNNVDVLGTYGIHHISRSLQMSWVCGWFLFFNSCFWFP